MLTNFSEGLEQHETARFPPKAYEGSEAENGAIPKSPMSSKSKGSQVVFGEPQTEYNRLSDYNAEAEYDACREWLRLITALVSICVGIVAVYPIHLGVSCYFDSQEDGSVDLTACKNLFNIEYSLSVLVVASVTEVVMMFLFFFSCRHEFCGVKRNYKAGFLCCPGRKSQTAIVYPTPPPQYDNLG